METKKSVGTKYYQQIIHTEFILRKYDLVILAGTARPAVVISGMPHSLANHSLQEIFSVMQTVSMNILAPIISNRFQESYFSEHLTTRQLPALLAFVQP